MYNNTELSLIAVGIVRHVRRVRPKTKRASQPQIKDVRRKAASMDVEAFILCDCATDQQGKLNILGAFDRLYTRKIPAIHPFCAVAVRLRFSKIEEGEHTIKINFIDADGNPAGPVLERKISVTVPENDDSSARNIIPDLCRPGFAICGNLKSKQRQHD
ncbi:MAG: hypothetical protein P8016_04950 [Sedimentisphaerales bacterium]